MSRQLHLFDDAPNRPRHSTLLDLLTGGMVYLVRTDRNRRYTRAAESRLMAQVEQLRETTGLEVFERNLNEWMRTTSVGNSGHFDAWYRLVRYPDRVEVWHRDSEGDPDRLVTVLTRP
ncbi:hypothetical protein [Spirosoma sordidisoli]|uniref:Uncharacterized protein n=1 Tax=Spirosoma sordidisoli TaxID=2502893 RepID=A0A4Q2UG20_9BACT|nr:hypothetical protein [Spirosoma sordidisoli]RYC66325.1 hypothetical protein EQG79_30080 [Spirosoma sordidisoli]